MSDLIDRQPEKRTIKRTETRACDCISREAAIDELDKGAWGVEWDKTLAKTMIESLPSAQPTQNTRVNSNNALDTISREAALEALDEIESEVADGEGFQYEKWRSHIAELPSAQPEPLTDKEQMIFLAAMEREEKVCEEVDRNYVREPYEDSLMRVCKEIRRKVKGALWT